MNQDTTTRVWDMRMLRKSVALLRGSMGAVRSLRFSPCGCFLAAAESVDFVHLYDVDADFGRHVALSTAWQFSRNVADTVSNQSADWAVCCVQMSRN